MRAGFELTKVLIVVKTYPHPSKQYQETVCTAGITEAGQWVRLYPIPFRYLPQVQQYKKWQWIEVALAQRGHRNDQRIESREPDVNTIRSLGEPLATTDKWRARRDVIDKLPHHTVRQLESLYHTEKVSLGIVRPKRVLDLKAVPVPGQWPAKHQQLWSQLRLFGEQKPLRKVPYKFQYVFECDDSDKPHQAMNEDWELGVLYLREFRKHGSEEAAVRSVRDKFLGEICRQDKDTRFFMGTRHPFNEWLVLGTFWPRKETRQTLFSV